MLLRCLAGGLRPLCSAVAAGATCPSLLQGTWAASLFSTSATPDATPPQPSTSTSATTADEPTPSLAQQYLDPALMSRAKKLQLEKQELVRAFRQSQADVGSVPVQVALLTHRIRSLEQHFKQHRKDHHSLRGLYALVQQRKRSLQYLRRSDFNAYSVVLHKLGLKDVYAPSARLDKYKTGTRLPFTTQPIKLYRQAKKQSAGK